MLCWAGCSSQSPAGAEPDGGVEGDGGAPDADVVRGPPLGVTIASPAVGTITEATQVAVEGVSHNASTADGLWVAGAPIVPQANGDWQANYAFQPGEVVQSIEAVLRRESDGAIARDRVALLAGKSVPDGALSPQSLALRINDSGLDALETLLAGELLSQLDLAEIVPVNTVIIDECVQDSFLGCVVDVKVKVVEPAPSFGDAQIALDATTDQIRVDLVVEDLAVNLDIDTNLTDCDAHLRADQIAVTGYYTMEPDPADPTRIDVNNAGQAVVTFLGFDDDLDCDLGFEDQIIGAFYDIEDEVRDALRDLLNDPDGDGPEDSLVADAAEDAFADLSIGDAFGDSFSATVSTPYFLVQEDETGITLGMDSSAVSVMIADGAPDLASSYEPDSTFPVLGDLTPSGAAYDVALCVAPPFFNQLFKAVTEGGLLNFEDTELGGTPITVAFLEQLFPAYGRLPDDEELVLALRPTMAPLLSGNAGSSGELAEVLAPHLIVEIRSADGTVHNRLAIDVKTGFDLKITPDRTGLEPTLSVPDQSNISVFVLDNSIGADEILIQGLIPSLVSSFVPMLAGDLGVFELPEFSGLRLEPIEVAREGAFFSIYANVSAANN